MSKSNQVGKFSKQDKQVVPQNKTSKYYLKEGGNGP